MGSARRVLTAVVAFVVAVSCGGGSGDPAESPSASPVPSTESPAVVSSAIDAGSGVACAELAGVPVRSGSLQSFLADAPITGANSGQFQEPSGTELTGFERALEAVARAPTAAAIAELKSYGFTATLLRDTSTLTDWLVFEDATAGRGAGTFALNLAPARELWLEAPHADYDQGTLAEGAHQAAMLGARAFLINGANRCAVSTATPCDGRTNVCGGELKISDAAHFDRTFFTSAHRALRAAFPGAVAVNLHGMDVEGEEAAVISDGTTLANRASISVRLRDALASRLPASQRAFSCNDPADDGQHRNLCGTTNVQGRLDNGAANACTGAASAASQRFLHLEQNAALRQAPAGDPLSDALVRALGELVPCGAGGNGLDCPEVAPPCG